MLNYLVGFFIIKNQLHNDPCCFYVQTDAAEMSDQ